jgi:hypothetical protein
VVILKKIAWCFAKDERTGSISGIAGAENKLAVA